jgi:hypothetical protein
MNGPQFAFDPTGQTTNPLVTEIEIGIQNLTGPWTDESKVLTGALEQGLPSTFVADLHMFDLNNLGRQFDATTSLDGPVCQPTCTVGGGNGGGGGGSTVPEPSTIASLLVGVLGLGMVRLYRPKTTT